MNIKLIVTLVLGTSFLVACGGNIENLPVRDVPQSKPYAPGVV